MYLVGILFITLFGLSVGQFPSVALTAPALGAVHYFPDQVAAAPLAHRDVLVNAEHEALLPAHLKNPFYSNPRVAEVLARESWFGPGETQVHHGRETEKIPRERIFSVLKNAGLARRR